MPKEKFVAQYADVRLCWNMHVMVNDQLQELSAMAEDNMQWMRDFLVEAKKTMATPEVQFLRKIPTRKRTKRATQTRTSKRNSKRRADESSQDESSESSKRSTRATRATACNTKAEEESPPEPASPPVLRRSTRSTEKPVISEEKKTEESSSSERVTSEEDTTSAATAADTVDEAPESPVRRQSARLSKRQSSRQSTRQSSRMSLARRRSSVAVAAAKALLLQKCSAVHAAPADLPVRATRSRMKLNNKNLQAVTATPQKTCSTPTPNTPNTVRSGPVRRSTRCIVKKAAATPVQKSKRVSTEDLNESASKRRKPNSRTTSPHAAAAFSNSKVSRAPIPAASFLNSLAKKPNQVGTPSHQSGSVFSFLPPKTSPKKTLSHQEAAEQRRRELQAKEKKAKCVINKRNQLLQERAEEQRRRREERQQLAAQRRQEQLSRELEMRKDINQRLEAHKNKEQLLEEKQQAEREKQRMRERKLQDAEVRRKHEEEARILKQKELEEEQRRLERLQAMKREQEEQERQRRLADQRKAAEERQAQLERERLAEAARIRKQEVEQRRQELERQKLREERERKLREERERQELERMRERERLRQREIEHKKEQEKLRLMQEQLHKEEEKHQSKYQKETMSMITAHNASINSQNTVCTKTVMNMSTSQQSSATASSHSAMNRTYDADQDAVPSKTNDCQSYEITPVRKVYTKSTADNYNIHDLHSDDSTDDDEDPKKKIPEWALGKQFRVQLIHQHFHPPDLDAIFGGIELPDLNKVFKKIKPNFDKRTSSACWTTPMYMPSGAPIESPSKEPEPSSSEHQ